MPIQKSYCWWILVLIIILAGSASGFDGYRKGFFIGAGIGLGISHIQSEIEKGPSGEITKFGPAFDFRIGYAPSNHLLIYYYGLWSVTYVNKVVTKFSDFIQWYPPITVPASPLALQFLLMAGSHSTIGLGLTYYFNESVPSFFVEGSMGIGIIPDEFAEDTKDGTGLSAGFGYEFQKRLNLKANLLVGFTRKPKDEITYDLEYDRETRGISLLFTLNFILY